MKVRITGLGLYSHDSCSKCILSGENPTGYIEINDRDEPCKLSILGTGAVGTLVDVPEQYQKTLKTLTSN